MNSDIASHAFRTQDKVVVPVSTYGSVPDIIEAMLQSIEGGELHARAPLDPAPGSPFLPFIEVGLALRTCLEDKSRRHYLIERLKPHVDVIIGTLPAGILPHGLLPKAARDYQQEFGFRNLEQISDDELRKWVIEDGGLIYGELKRYELENYFEAIAPFVPSGGTMYDLGSGLGKVVMSAAVNLPFERCIGVELLDYRHRMAQERMTQMLAVADHGLASLPAPLAPDAEFRLPAGAVVSASHLTDMCSRISFIEQDMFKVNVSDAHLVFVYSTCFGPLMNAIADKLARELPERSLVSTTTYALKHPAFQLIRHFPAQTLAWIDVFLYERIGALDTLATPPPVSSYAPDADAWEARVRQEFDLIDARTV